MFISRDETGKINRASAKPFDGGESISDSEYSEEKSAPDCYQQMSALESTRTERRMREARMEVEGAQEWLDALDIEIESIRP